MQSIANKVNKTKLDRNRCFLWFIVLICAIEYLGIGQYVSGIQSFTIFLLGFIFLLMISSDAVREAFGNGQAKALIIFFFHTGISMFYAIVTTYSFLRFKLVAGYILLFLVIYMALKKLEQIHLLMASLVVFHCVIIMTNLEKFNMSMNIRSTGYRAGYFLGDANDLAWSLCIFLPFVIYFITLQINYIIKGISIFGVCLFLIGIVGTGSRGASLSLAASIVYLVLNSKKRGKAILVTFILSVCAFALIPHTYFSRIKTIESYEEDSSALGRIMAWNAAIRMAIDHPLGVGAGNFNTAYGRFYRAAEADHRIYAASRWISAHSIYFQVLGEFGIFGLITIGTLLFLNFKTNQQQLQAFKSKKLPDRMNKRVYLLPKYLSMSMVSYCVGGFFLSGIYYPHLFILTAIILKTRKLLNSNKG